MSRYKPKKAAALRYDEASAAPIIVASGLGYMAEKIVEIAAENNLPVYEDNSLATVLTQLEVGAPIPPELYQAIVEIYVYFMNGCQTMPAPFKSDSETEDVQAESDSPEQAEDFAPMEFEEF